MRLTWLFVLGVIAAAPANAQYHPNLESLENRHLDEVEQQRADNARIARANATKQRAPSEAEKKAAAWRADHLTCVSPHGRTAAQFQAECKPAGPGP